MSVRVALHVFRPPRPPSCERGWYIDEIYVYQAIFEPREVSDGSDLRTQGNHAVTRETHRDIVTEPPHNQEASTSRVPAVRQRRVVYLGIFCLCLSAVAAIFTVVILESLRVESASISGSIQAIVLAIFSLPLTTNVCVTAVIIFRILRVALVDNQLDSQAGWDTYRGVIMNVIEGCVVYPAILLNIIRAHSQYYGGQNVLDNITQVPTILLSLVWITLWFRGGQDAPGESADQESIAIPSGGDRPAVAGEMNHRGPPEVTSNIFDPFRHGNAMEMAASTLVVG